MGGKTRFHPGRDATDMDVELVLGARMERVDRHGDVRPADRPAEPRRQQVPLPPGRRPVVRRIRCEQRRILDAGDFRGRHQQQFASHMGDRDDRIAALIARADIDPQARRRRSDKFFGRNTKPVHHGPQHVSAAGANLRRDRLHARRQHSDHQDRPPAGPQQAHSAVTHRQSPARPAAPSPDLHPPVRAATPPTV